MQTEDSGAIVAITCSVALAIMTGWILWIGQSILIPVVIGVITVYVLDSASEALTRFGPLARLRRRWRRVLVLIVSACLLLVLAAFIASNTAALSKALPDYADRVHVLQLRLLGALGIESEPSWENIGERLLDYIDATEILPAVLSTVSAGGSVLVAAILYAAFILAELDFLPEKTRLALGTGPKAERTLEIVRQINQRIGDYLAAKTLINIVLGLVSWVLLLLLGIEHAVFWAILIGLLNYIPYVGSILAVFFPVTMSLVQNTSIVQALIALVVLAIPQIVIGYYVEPRFLGRSVNLSPVTVLVALAVWSALWGLMGAILAVPLTAMIAIILAEIPPARFIAVLMSDKGEV